MTGMRISPKLDTPLLGNGDAGAPSAGGAPLAAQVNALERAAHVPSSNAWSSGKDLRDARNAHRTNLVPELRRALAGPFDWFEGDIRMRGADPVMAHDADQVGAAMTLDDWIKVGAPSGRGLKLDCKDASVIEPAIAKLRGKVPDDRVLFNVAVGVHSPAAARASSSQLADIRAAFPSAVINLDPGPAPYDPRDIANVIKVARAVGGKVMFPLDAKALADTPANRAMIDQLRAVGRVAVWNDPATFAPGDVDATTKRFRAMGVNGTIDLRGGMSHI
jgi:hypothetical protein